MGEYRVAVKSSTVDGNSAVTEVVGGVDAVLEFDSEVGAVARVTELSAIGDRTLSLQTAAPQDERDIDAYLVSYDGPGRRWEVIRAEVKERDDYTCRRCGEEKGYERRAELDVHHITPESEGGSDGKDNLTTWCKDCHQHVHAEEKRDGTLAELKAFIQDYPKPYILPKEIQSETDISLIKGKLWKLTTRWVDLEVVEYCNHVAFYRPGNGVNPDDFLFTHDSWNTERAYDADDPFRDATILRGPVFYKDDIIVEE